MTGQVGIMSGTLWMLQNAGRYMKVKATLHPPDVYPAAFVGGSNLAIVKKYDDEDDPGTTLRARARRSWSSC